MTDTGTRSKFAPFAGREVVQSLRRVTRTSQQLMLGANEVLERELAMAVSISEGIRDHTITEGALSEARAGRLHARLRGDAHRIVDLAADIAGVATGAAISFISQFAGQERPSLTGETAASSPSV